MAENLGTNDALQGNIDWTQSFDQVLELMLPLDCVILTTVSVRTNHLDPTHSHIADRMNEAIAAAKASHPNVRVVDWNAAVDKNTTDFAADGFHPTTRAAQVWLAHQYRKVADSCA